jgi:hypothetical protein
MSLPTQNDQLGMGVSFNAQPFVRGTSSSTITLNGMGYVFNAQPFVANEPPVPVVGGWPHKLNGLSAIGKINNILLANVSKVNGV